MRKIETYFNGGASAQVPVADPLPTAGRLGRLMIDGADKKLYRDDGANWVEVG